MENLLDIKLINLFSLVNQQTFFSWNRNNFQNIVNKPELHHPFEEKDVEVEPNNPYYTSNMVVMNRPNLKYEKVKNNYLVKKNMEYIKVDDDELNKSLLPQGTMFAHP